MQKISFDVHTAASGKRSNVWGATAAALPPIPETRRWFLSRRPLCPRGAQSEYPSSVTLNLNT